MTEILRTSALSPIRRWAIAYNVSEASTNSAAFQAVVVDPLSEIASAGQLSESIHLVSVRAPGAVVVLLLQPVREDAEVSNYLWVAQNLGWI